MDDVLTELQITPDVLEIPCPRFFLEERSKELEQREKLLVFPVRDSSHFVERFDRSVFCKEGS